MTPIAPHITAFLRERLPIERRASVHTCDTYAYAFRLLFEFASQRLGIRPSELQLEHIDAVLVMAFLEHLQEHRSNGARTRNVRLAAIKSFARYVEYRVPSALDQIRRHSPSRRSAPTPDSFGTSRSTSRRHCWTRRTRRRATAPATARSVTSPSPAGCASPSSSVFASTT
jgi:site-specific recombinase XerD